MSKQSTSVLSYFQQAIDGAQPDLVFDLFTEDCKIHRPELELRGNAALARLIGLASSIYEDFHTEIHELLEAGDTVAVRLSHSAISRSTFLSRTGIYDVSGQPISWDAMAMFRFEQDRIAEEWVNRDELGMLIRYGILPHCEEAAARLRAIAKAPGA